MLTGFGPAAKFIWGDTMNYTEAGAYTNDVTIAEGADINAAGVTLTNTESGRIVGGVRFNQGGSTVINQLGGIVRVADGECHRFAHGRVGIG